MGMGTRPVTYPILIPPNQRAIIQLNHLANTVQINSSYLSAPTIVQASASPPTVTYTRTDPITYQVAISTSHPFVLVFSAPYDRQWRAFYGSPLAFQLFSPAISENDQLMMNGYANGWYVNRTGTFTMTLYYTPQNLYYLGLSISVVFTIAVFITLTRVRFVGRDVFLRLRKILWRS
jgi:hypothetical protein